MPLKIFFKPFCLFAFCFLLLCPFFFLFQHTMAFGFCLFIIFLRNQEKRPRINIEKNKEILIGKESLEIRFRGEFRVKFIFFAGFRAEALIRLFKTFPHYLLLSFMSPLTNFLLSFWYSLVCFSLICFQSSTLVLFLFFFLYFFLTIFSLFYSRFWAKWTKYI